MPVEGLPRPLWHRCQAVPTASGSLTARQSAGPALTSAQPHTRKRCKPSSTNPYSRGVHLTRSPTVSRSSRTFSSRSKFLSVRVSTISSAPKAASTCKHTHHNTLQPGAQHAVARSKVLLCHRGITLARCGTWLINSFPIPGVRVCQIVLKLSQQRTASLR